MVLIATLVPTLACAQLWPMGPDDPTIQADRLRYERDRWRAGQDEREASARADQRRTEAVLYGLRSQRGPAVPPPPGPTADLAPPPDLHLLEQQAAESARERARDAEDRLDSLRVWLDRNRVP